MSLHLIYLMESDQAQPVIPLGFGHQPAGSSSCHIDIKVPFFVTATSSLYIMVPQHFLALTSNSYPVSPQQSRDRIAKMFDKVEWSQLAEVLNQVWEAKGHRFLGHPSESDWQGELELLHQAHTRAYRGY